MGNYHTRPIRFLQSPADFPLTVSLGKKAPSWGLSRWDGGGVRFVPPDDEGFALRGDRRRLIYRGRRRSHRFTILGDTAFEYDCILEREPESNVIYLVMEGAEQFDFFRQPDFIKEPLLAGSYAVYKKETLLGEGTGKLCHIHRPEIIDARGRRCWGDLSVAGNQLRITIPESFLSEAAYPVIVDPTIGTSTVGSQTHWNNVENESYDQLFIEVSIAVNRFYISEALTGAATAYVYAYDSDYDGRCKPVIYTDYGNIPLNRKSKNEGTFDIAVKSGKPAGWRSTTFQSDGSIAAGSYIWFGLFCDWFAPRFDFGAKCYKDFWDYDGDDILNTYPLYSANSYYDFKLSMYFAYTSAQNYTRTLTQSVKLTDTRKLTGTYKRTTTQTVRGTTTLQRFEGFYRKCVMNVQNSMALKRSETFIRTTAHQIKAMMGISSKRDMIRALANQTAVQSAMTRKGDSKRTIAETGKLNMGLTRYAGINLRLTMTSGASGTLFKALTFPRRVVEAIKAQDSAGTLRGILRILTVPAGNSGKAGAGIGFKRDIASQVMAKTATSRFPVFLRSILNEIKSVDHSAYSVVWLRCVLEQETVLDWNKHISGYIRGLYVAAGSLAETKHTGNYYRKQTDTAHIEAISLRHLIIFIKLATVGLVRDFLIRRFLKSNEEFVLKSCVCREITLESGIH
jgi:hypothetical protein